MKKLALFGTLMIILVSMVHAISFEAVTGNSVTNEGTLLTFQLNVIGLSAGASVTYAMTGAPSGATLSPTGLFSYTPGYNVATANNSLVQFSITFTATDNSTSEVATMATPIQIRNANQPPVVNAGVDRTVLVNTLVTLAGTVTDADAEDTLIMGWTAPSGITLSNANSLTPTFTPTTAGTYTITLSADDGNASVSDTVTITVNSNTTTPVSQSKLVLDDLIVKFGTRRSSGLEDDSTVSKDAEPGDKMTIEAKVKNTLTDMDIEDVFMEVTLENIDDGSDLDDETDEETISDDDTETFKLEFEIPLRLDDDSYNIHIEIEGQDENGTTHRIVKDISFDIDRENDDVRIMEATLTPSTVSCNRNSNLNINILNLGEDDQDDVRITATNSNLGLDFVDGEDEDIELATGNDDDAEYSVSVPINARNLPVGDYPIEITVFRDTDREEDKRTVTLTIDQCQTTTGSQTTTNQSTSSGNVVVTTPGTSTGGNLPTGTVPVVAVSETSFASSPLYIVLLGLGALILVALIIWIVVLLVRK